MVTSHVIVCGLLKKYDNGETLNSVSTLVEEICQQPMHYMLTNSLDNFVTDC